MKNFKSMVFESFYITKTDYKKIPIKIPIIEKIILEDFSGFYAFDYDLIIVFSKNKKKIKAKFYIIVNQIYGLDEICDIKLYNFNERIYKWCKNFKKLYAFECYCDIFIDYCCNFLDLSKMINFLDLPKMNLGDY